MTARLRLKRLEVAAFRGAGERVGIPLDRPLNIVHGPNGSGKSTLATAIEWALYPRETLRLRDTGIAERREWEVRHVHTSDFPEVSLTLDQDGSELTLRQHGLRGTIRHHFAIATTYSDFKHLVFVHQETLRGFLVGPPGPRQEAFARLLGAGWAQDLQKSLVKARKELRCDDADRTVAEAERLMAAKMSEVSRLLGEERQRAGELGLRAPWREAAEAVTTQVGRMAESLAQTAGMALPELPPLSPAREYRARLAPVLERLRQAGPAQRQSEAAARKGRIGASASAYGAARQERDHRLQQLQQAGSAETLEQRLADLTTRREQSKQHLASLNRHRAVVAEAIAFFRDQPEPQQCPVCGQGVPVSLPGELERHFLASASETEARVSGELSVIAAELEQTRGQLEGLRAVRAAADRAEERLRQEADLLAHVLEREIRADEDPLAVARLEVERMDKLLAELDLAVSQWLARIGGIEEEARKIDTIVRVVALESRMNKLAAVRQTPEWNDMIARQQELSRKELQFRLLADRTRLLAARLASVNLERVREPVSAVYAHLTARNDFDRVTIDPERKYEVGIEGTAAEAAPTAVLNLTDLNALAIAIIAGMATTCRDSTELDFLVLDDPSQGMDPSVTARLAEVLCQLSATIQLVVATPDPDLVDGLERCPRQKNVIRLEPRDQASPAPFVRVASVER